MPVDGQPMTREELKRYVALVGSSLCAYMPGHGNAEKWVTSRCGCKFGLSGRGEQNGCAEMRSLHRRLTCDDGFHPFLGLMVPPEAPHA